MYAFRRNICLNFLQMKTKKNQNNNYLQMHCLQRQHKNVTPSLPVQPDVDLYICHKQIKNRKIYVNMYYLHIFIFYAYIYTNKIRCMVV